MAESKSPRLTVHSIFAWIFATLFLILCSAILISTISTFAQFIFSSEVFYRENEIPEVIINAISNLIIALAIFELYVVIRINIRLKPGMTMDTLLDTAPRFIIVVCVALALEGLVLVIKLIQDENIDALLSPIAVIFSAAVLLVCLGLFLKICPRKPKAARAEEEIDLNAE